MIFRSGLKIPNTTFIPEFLQSGLAGEVKYFLGFLYYF